MSTVTVSLTFHDQSGEGNDNVTPAQVEAWLLTLLQRNEVPGPLDSWEVTGG